MDMMRHSAVAFGWEYLCRRHRDAPRLVTLERDPTLSRQSYRITYKENRLLVSAAEESGMMYGLLDLADLWDGAPDETLNREISPRILRRGIKFNIPLDARTPSYSDASDSAFENIAQVWDRQFWETFLDEMALRKFNVLTLWSLSPFPSLVRIPEYPEVALEDVMASNIPPRPDMSGDHMYTPDMEPGLYCVKRITMDEKIGFWRWVMEYAAGRCIRVYIFTWNLFVFGTEGNPYGITCDQGNPVTRDYVYRGAKALLDTYPLLAGFGVTAGEHMAGDATDIPFLRQTYGRAVEEHRREHPERAVELIHRMQYARYNQIMEHFAGLNGDFSISFKYSQAHMHSSPEPDFYNAFRREFPGEEPVWFTVRDDDYYLYRWGDPDFARAYLGSMPAERMKGFYLGADGFTWGRDYTGYGDGHPLYLEKMWFKFDLLGQIAYDPGKTDGYFLRKLTERLGCDGGPVLELWKKASRIFPLLHCTHWNDYDFQWYPEGCCRFLHPPVGKLVFSDINEFLNCPAMPGAGCLSVREYCAAAAEGSVITKKTPEEVWRQMRCLAREILEKTERLPAPENRELGSTLRDIRALGLLGSYYSLKLEAAVELGFYRQNRRETDRRDRAVELLRQAAGVWKTYSRYSMSLYRPQRLTRLGGRYVDFRAFDRAAELDAELAAGQ